MRVEFENRIQELESYAQSAGQRPQVPRGTTYERLLAEALLAERRTILQLRNEKFINDEVLRRIQRDLDLKELRFKRD